jgi:hypothetical protein
MCQAVVGLVMPNRVGYGAGTVFVLVEDVWKGRVEFRILGRWRWLPTGSRWL